MEDQCQERFRERGLELAIAYLSGKSTAFPVMSSTQSGAGASVVEVAKTFESYLSGNDTDKGKD